MKRRGQDNLKPTEDQNSQLRSMSGSPQTSQGIAAFALCSMKRRGQDNLKPTEDQNSQRRSMSGSPQTSQTPTIQEGDGSADLSAVLRSTILPLLAGLTGTAAALGGSHSRFLRGGGQHCHLAATPGLVEAYLLLPLKGLGSCTRRFASESTHESPPKQP